MHLGAGEGIRTSGNGYATAENAEKAAMTGGGGQLAQLVGRDGNACMQGRHSGEHDAKQPRPG